MQDFVSYSTRPAWDAPDGPKTLLPHLQADGVSADDAAACKRHSWQMRAAKPKVIDAFLFATEIELLEVRLRELWDVVDEFVIVESTHSLMGQPKVSILSRNGRLLLPTALSAEPHLLRQPASLLSVSIQDITSRLPGPGDDRKRWTVSAGERNADRSS